MSLISVFRCFSPKPRQRSLLPPAEFTAPPAFKSRPAPLPSSGPQPTQAQLTSRHLLIEIARDMRMNELGRTLETAIGCNPHLSEQDLNELSNAIGRLAHERGRA